MISLTLAPNPYLQLFLYLLGNVSALTKNDSDNKLHVWRKAVHHCVCFWDVYLLPVIPPPTSNSLAPACDVIFRTGQFLAIGHLGPLIFRKGFFVLLLSTPLGLRDLSFPQKNAKPGPSRWKCPVLTTEPGNSLKGIIVDDWQQPTGFLCPIFT